MKNLFSNKIILYGSIISLIYFISLKLISDFNITHTLIGVFGELLTIPFIILTIVFTIMSILNWKKEKFKLNSTYFISLIFTVLTIALVISFFL